MSRQRFLGSLFLAMLLIVVNLAGCGKSNPVSTGFSGGAGYSINLGATSGSLPFGGRLALTATIKDPDGKAVQTSVFPVTLTSNLGGEFAPIQAQIVNGIVSSIYVAPKLTLASVRAQTTVPTVDTLPTPGAVSSDLPIVDTITMSFLGASAKLTITLYKP